MKNHIAFKSAAVFLAALMLLGAVASGFAILLISDYDLYNQTWEEGYEENMRDSRENFSQALIFRYASMELGGCSTPLIDDYYGNGAMYTSFRWGRYAYSVRNGNGEVMISLNRDIPNAEHFEIPVENGRFVYLISEKDVAETTAERLQTAGVSTASETEALQTETAAETVPAAEPSTQIITPVEETEAEPETAVEVTPVAETEPSAETAAPAEAETAAAEEEPVPAEAETAAAEEEPVPAEAETAAAEEESVSAEAETAAAEEEPAPAETETAAAEEESVPAEAETAAAESETNAAAETASAETFPAETEAAEETALPEETASAAVIKAAEEASKMEAYHANPYFTRDQYEEAFSYPYYNYESGMMKDATLCYASTSEFTVDLYLAPDALYDYQTWNLLKVIAPVRMYLIAALVCCLLLFASLMVYLCCTAGRKPGSSEVEPVGFHQMPLDLYSLLLAGGVLGCIWLTSAGRELFQNTQMIQMLIGGGACFLGCLLLICYSLAWAAQIKMQHLYCLKNTLIFRALLLMGRGISWLGRQGVRQIKRLPAAWHWLAAHMGRWINMALMLMPAMYQWLICSGLILLLVLLALAFGSSILLILSVIVYAAVTIYGACSFGLLLRGVRQMRGGDLKTKVDSRFLVGSMKEFAQELNGLADVAGVAAEKQLKSERMKTELITNVSHDIKTPLTSIINYVDLMERPHTREEQAEYMEVLSRQSQRLKKLIDDLMEMSKASTGNMQTDITEVNAVEAINQCLGEFTDKLQKADLSPVFHAPDHDVTMLADGRLVWRVMSNLLGNAVKYALPGTRVYVDLNELSDDVIISVKNVSREELNISTEELMERFVRGDASRNTEGSGLGLNIAKSLMELQHGHMELLVDGDLFKVTLIFPRK